jgi:nucleotide-binding universal stress UspA family protein
VTWTKNVLVVANVTSVSDELMAALRSQAASEPTTFYLIVPTTPSAGGRAAAEDRLRAAIERLRGAGLRVEGRVGRSGLPIDAVMEVWDPKRYDAIVVSTLPMGVSKWLRGGLPERIAHLTGAPVTHVVSRPPRPRIAAEPAPPNRRSPIGPLSVLGWGRAQSERHPAREGEQSDSKRRGGASTPVDDQALHSTVSTQPEQRDA